MPNLRCLLNEQDHECLDKYVTKDYGQEKLLLLEQCTTHEHEGRLMVPQLKCDSTLDQTLNIAGSV